jgi:hypothetical protein
VEVRNQTTNIIIKKEIESMRTQIIEKDFNQSGEELVYKGGANAHLQTIIKPFLKFHLNKIPTVLKTILKSNNNTPIFEVKNVHFNSVAHVMK